jgi:hypothetical protein
MGKRELVKKPRNPRDLYPTVDPAAAYALAPFLEPQVAYVEPCAGDGSLIKLLASVDRDMWCMAAYDIDPQANRITQRNCLTLTKNDVEGADCFITNPPFQWDMLQPILDHLPTLLPTWLLLPADSMHNKRMSPYMDFCSDVVSIGRLYWMKDKPIKGVDNNCWYKFDSKYEGFTKFHPRAL